MKIICLTQRPIQTLTLIYLLGSKNIFFDHIFYSPLKKRNLLGFKDEGTHSWKGLKYQCKLMNISFDKVSNINSRKFLKKLKKINPDCMISFVVDTIFTKQIISVFKKGIYSSHGGIMPKYRGNDCSKWAVINNEKFVGITLQKINKGIDTGRIVKVSKLPIKNFKSVKDINKKLYYQFKLNDFVEIVQKLKKNKKIRFLKKQKIGKQYFEMHRDLEKIASQKLK